MTGCCFVERLKACGVGDRIFSFVLDHARQQMAWVTAKFVFGSLALFANITKIFVKWFTAMFIYLLFFIIKPAKLHDAHTQ